MEHCCDLIFVILFGSVWNISLAYLSTTTLPEDPDSVVCETKSFRKKCNQNEVILMETGVYGRMNIGICVHTDYGYIGCSKDVMPEMDTLCSGKRSCNVPVPNEMLTRNTSAKNNCPAEFKSYLRATATCVPVEDFECHQCHGSSPYVQLSHPSGYIPSIVSWETTNNTKCGQSQCPWRIKGQEGQKINLTIWDFTLGNITGPPRHNVLGNIHEGGKIVQIRSGKERVHHIYTSTTHQVDISVVSPDVFRRWGHIIIYYELIDCGNLPVPDHAWTEREGNRTKVGCLANSDEWILICKNHQWEGKLGVCPEHLSRANQDKPSVTLPLGVLIAIIIGIALIIGVCILTIGLICLKRRTSLSYRRPETASYRRGGRGRRGMGEDDIAASTPLQYSKKLTGTMRSTTSRTSTAKRKKRGGTENVYLESRPLPAIPSEEGNRNQQVCNAQVYQRSASVQDHYKHPRPPQQHLPATHQHSTPGGIICLPDDQQPQYFVLDPDELVFAEGQPSVRMYGGYPQPPTRLTGVHSPPQAPPRMHGPRVQCPRHRHDKSPEEENAENFTKEASCHDVSKLGEDCDDSNFSSWP